MNQLTFQKQMWIGMGIIAAGLVLAHLLKHGIFSNLAWILCGLLFVIHPVCPEKWEWRYANDAKRMRRDFRIAGAGVIIIGILTCFGV